MIVDDDYNVIRGGKGTEHFIENFLRQTSQRLTGKDATIRFEEKIKTTIKQNNGKSLTLYAYVAPKNSRWISLVDAYLGLCVSEKNIFSKMSNYYGAKIE